MKQTLSRDHRKILETTVAQARAAAEAGAAKDTPAHATDAQKKLHVRLRAHGRALGDLLRPDDTQTIDQLVTEIAYEHWHRMLFARFLAESDLRMHPDGYPPNSRPACPASNRSSASWRALTEAAKRTNHEPSRFRLPPL
jgi:hypothetical protein